MYIYNCLITINDRNITFNASAILEITIIDFPAINDSSDCVDDENARCISDEAQATREVIIGFIFLVQDNFNFDIGRLFFYPTLFNQLTRI